MCVDTCLKRLLTGSSSVFKEQRLKYLVEIDLFEELDSQKNLNATAALLCAIHYSYVQIDIFQNDLELQQ